MAPVHRPREPAAPGTLLGQLPLLLARGYSLPEFVDPPVCLEMAEQRATDTGDLFL